VGYNQASPPPTEQRTCLEKKNLFFKINLFLIGITLLDAKTSCITVAKVFVSYVSFNNAIESVICI